jgi:hypothetical protein
MHDPASEVRRIPLPRTPVNKVKKKQLSWMSRGKILRRPPRGAVFEDSVEDREQLAHAGHQGYLLGFASRQKTLVEFLHYRVATRGDQGAHVQRSSDLGSTSPHATMAAQGARVAVERSDPNQGGHSLVRERGQLGHSSQSRVRARTGPTPGTLRSSASFSPKELGCSRSPPPDRLRCGRAPSGATLCEP